MKQTAMNLFAATATVLLVSGQAFAAQYTLDTAHTSVNFSVKHMMISTVNGKFKDFDGTFNFDAAKDEVKDAKFSVKTASVDTDNAKRDEHLRSPDFFDAAKYPSITLTHSKITKVSKDNYKWVAEMDMHGVKKPVTFDLEYKGSVKGMDGAMHAGFGATAKISRKEFGLTWNKALEAGGAVVGDDVKIDIEIEAIEAGAAGAAPAHGKKK